MARPRSRAPEQTEAEREAERQEKQIQLEIEQGKREPVTRMRYGLHERKERKEAAPALPCIGDGGASWRAKMLQRAQERVEEKGTSLAEVSAATARS